MTRTKKLFVAAAILAAGYGVASLFGEPAAMLVSGTAPPHHRAAAQKSNRAALSAPIKYAPGELRLVPDARPMEVPVPEATLQPPEHAPDAFSTELSLADVAAPIAPSPSEPAWFSNFSMNAPAPARASLRNEVPRPVFPETRAGVAPLAGLPAVQADSPTANAPPPAHDGSPEATSSVVAADYAQDATRRATSQMALATSSWAPPVESATAPNPFVASPPFASIEEEEPRTHIVVDGDSLAKLAGRYLDDPRRSHEIYDLNRHVLSDPELLPIGAELSIPSRHPLPSNSSVPQSALPGSLAVHSAARGGLVPVRPVPPNVVMMPRAQLARPLPAP